MNVLSLCTLICSSPASEEISLGIAAKNALQTGLNIKADGGQINSNQILLFYCPDESHLYVLTLSLMANTHNGKNLA